jgi:predicted dehydrogenase
MLNRPLNLAIIGCGAITEHAHLPVASSLDAFRVSVLVDRDLRRAGALAEQYGVEHVAADYARMDEKPDAALIALPPHLHARASIELLRQGVHVLVEKPMAIAAADCDEMIRAAEASKAQLAVGLVRRFLSSFRLARAILDANIIGPVESFDLREGLVYDWPTTSDSLFRRETAGGGVLMDTGVYTLDALLFWLGEVESLEYFDDNGGGVEADCELRLLMRSGAQGIVELSRTRRLRNTARLKGTDATLEVSLHSNTVSLHQGTTSIDVTKNPQALGLKGNHSGLELFRAQLVDWAESIQSERPPAVTGTDGRRAVALIEACYAQRRPLVLPWVALDSHRETSV